MKNFGFGEIVVRQLLDLLPYHLSALTSAVECPSPGRHHVMAKCRQCTDVRRYGVISKVASNDLPKPFPCLGNWPVQPPSQSFPNPFERRPHAVPTGLPLYEKATAQGASAYEDETKEGKVSGFPSPRCLRLIAAKRPNSIRRVLTGCNESENSCNLSRIASQKRRASLSFWKPQIFVGES